MSSVVDTSLYHLYNLTGVAQVVNYDAIQSPQLRDHSNGQKLPLSVLMPPCMDRLHRKTGHGGEI